MPLKVVVKDMPDEFKTFDELPRGELFRKITSTRTEVFQKLNNQDYSVIHTHLCSPGGPYQLGPSERQMRTYVPIKATLTIEG